MRTHGLPESFWVVTFPSPHYDLGDCCFRCDFERFVLQIRGGLDEKKIVGIFAEEAEAVALAERLLRTVKDITQEPDLRIHKSPWPEWYATQESLAGVLICDKVSGERVLIEPPKDWGRHWAWNLAEDGTGIVIRRTS